ncbi:hypothetical protein JDV02_010145 [Purpureocillium takamizusanense]|uniref:Uncharacterized protein n=1 Tax=Purpureocillium takamizusanense TaxID=2060973 RepID=A0A9Q8VGC7_9HYPO|nr:uncharacterized protein JDV02_010145 [Purpureocillium takamizusanense]UNI24396.1 hypothetical protein JDV02_010145 [Purpureocillium takamizusanense]
MSVPVPAPSRRQALSVRIGVTFISNGPDTHIIVPDTLSEDFVRRMANNLSARSQQPVKVFHDAGSETFRVCPWRPGNALDPALYGVLRFECNAIRLQTTYPRDNRAQALYTLYHSAELREEEPHLCEEEIALLVRTMWEAEPLGEQQLWEYWAWEERCDLHRRLIGL